MRRVLRLAAIIAAIAATLVVLPEEASACSCDYPNPRKWLVRSDGAFVGELVARPEEEHRGEGDYIFKVEQAIKGELSDKIVVRAALASESCGLELGIGQRIGLFLFLEDGYWKSSLCSQIAPDLLLAAAEPLPEPDGEGPIVALASIITSEGRTVALEADGNTLAYGAGRGEVAAYALCPGGRTVIEHVFDPTDAGLRYRIGVRDLRGFHVVREITGADVPGAFSTRAIACLDPEGDEILIFAGWDQGDRRNGRIVRIRGDSIETVIKFPEQLGCSGEAAFDIPNGLVYFTGGRDCRTLYRYDMASDATVKVATIPDAGVQFPWQSDMALSPDSRYLAIEEHPGPRGGTFRVWLADLQAEQVGFIEGVYTDSPHRRSSFWLAPDRYLLTGPAKRGQALVVDPHLNTVATIDELPGGPGGIQDETIYVVGFGGRLVSAPAGGGEARALRTFLAPEVRAFVVLPQGVPFDPAVTGTNNIAANPTAQSTAAPTPHPTTTPLQADRASPVAARDTGDSRDGGALTTGRMVGAGLVVFIAVAAGFLLTVYRRGRQGNEA